MSKAHSWVSKVPPPRAAAMASAFGDTHRLSGSPHSHSGHTSTSSPLDASRIAWVSKSPRMSSGHPSVDVCRAAGHCSAPRRPRRRNRGHPSIEQITAFAFGDTHRADRPGCRSPIVWVSKVPDVQSPVQSPVGVQNPRPLGGCPTSRRRRIPAAGGRRATSGTMQSGITSFGLIAARLVARCCGFQDPVLSVQS